MTEKEREERARQYIAEVGWPTEEEMRAFLEECKQNPVSYEEIMANLEEIRQITEGQLLERKAK